MVSESSRRDMTESPGVERRLQLANAIEQNLDVVEAAEDVLAALERPEFGLHVEPPGLGATSRA